MHIIASVGPLPGISDPSIPLPPPFSQKQPFQTSANPPVIHTYPLCLKCTTYPRAVHSGRPLVEAAWFHPLGLIFPLMDCLHHGFYAEAPQCLHASGPDSTQGERSTPQGLASVSEIEDEMRRNFQRRLTERHWSGRAHVLIRMLVEHLLEHIDWDVGLIQQHVVMSRARRPFQCFVRTQVDVVLDGVGDIAVDQGPRERVLILITGLAGEEANVMSLLGHNHGEFDRLASIVSRKLINGQISYLLRCNDHVIKDALDVSDFVMNHVKELPFRHPVTEVIDMFG